MPTLKEICSAVGGTLRGDGDVEIRGVGSLEGAGAGEIAPLDDKNYVAKARTSRASALMVATKLADEVERSAIVHDFPLVAMNALIEALGLAPRRQTGVHGTAIVDPGTRVPASVSIGAYAIIGPDVEIGERCVVMAHAQIEPGVTVGDDTVIERGAILHEGAVIGARCTIGSYAVISRQGFGFTKGPTGPVRLLHVGRTVIGDDTHVGAHCCVDRARYDETRVGTMSGLDNHVHIGHNCRVGDRSFLAAQTGLAGHAVVGDDCELAGQVGLANAVKIGDGAKIGAQAGIIGDVPPGEVWWGTPGKSLKLSLRMEATLRRLTRGRKE